MQLNLPNSLDRWLALLEQRSPESVFRLGLERIAQVWERLEITPPAGRVISVAGTNGKGSCALFCEALLGKSGFAVGATLSPHLDRFNERIRIDGIEASDEIIAAGMAAVEQAREGVDLSYFEHTILAALWCFDQAKLDAWVLEVGLGGRLDAVNLVDADVAIVSTIGIEHTQWLGDTLEAIGREKAGILRSGKPLVCGSTELPQSVMGRASDLGCPVYVPEEQYQFSNGASGFLFQARIDTGSMELHSKFSPLVAPENAATATMACALLLEDDSMTNAGLEFACREVMNPGRLEQRRIGDLNVTFDLAHNPQAAEFLNRQLDRDPVAGLTRAVCGFLSDKDVVSTIQPLLGLVDEWAFVGTPGARGRSGSEVAELAAKLLREGSYAVYERPGAAIERMKGVSCASDRLLVFGSFATVGEARRILRSGEDAGRAGYVPLEGVSKSEPGT